MTHQEIKQSLIKFLPHIYNTESALAFFFVGIMLLHSIKQPFDAPHLHGETPTSTPTVNVRLSISGNATATFQTFSLPKF